MKKTPGSAARRPSASAANRKSPAASKPLPARQRQQPLCFVYVVGAVTPRGPVTYVGWTVDLEQRLSAHNGKGGAKFTKGRAWQLLYAEGFRDRRKAMSREWHLKKDRALRTMLRLSIKSP